MLASDFLANATMSSTAAPSFPGRGDPGVEAEGALVPRVLAAVRARSHLGLSVLRVF